MKKSGYIKLFRAIEDWAWIDDPTMLYFWIRILLMANWEDREWHGMIVERGSFVTTLAELSKTLNLSVRQVRTCLERTQNDKQIACKTTSKWTKITICKYDDYQGGATNERQTNDTLGDKPTTQTKEGSEYSDSNESSYSSQEEKNINNNTQNAQAPVLTYAREESAQPPTPFPYPAPFILSSMEREMCRFGKWTEPQFKRNHLEANLRVIASQVGMDEAEQKRFLDYWCQPLDTSPTDILAQKSGAFYLRYRAEKWMEKNKPADKPQKSRLEQYTEKSQQLTQFINEFYGNSSNHGAADGPIVSPDEQ